MKDLSLHLMDILQNSIVASSKEILIGLSIDEKELKLDVFDNGVGMDEEFLKHVTDPFTTTRTTRKVGLGIPLLKDSCEMAGGSLTILSKQNVGTKIKATFVIDNIDRIPVGDVPTTIFLTMISNENINFKIKFASIKGDFEISTNEIKEEIEDIPLYNLEVSKWIQTTIKDAFDEIFSEFLNEVSQ